MLRLEGLSPEARELVELLCLRRRGASAAQLTELASSLTTERLLVALEELVRAGDVYACGNPAVYALAQRLSEERNAQSEWPPFEADKRQVG